MSSYITTAVLFLLLTAPSAAQSPTEYDKLLTKAGKNFGSRAEKLDKEFGLKDFDRWDYLQADGHLRFSDGGVTRVLATAQIVGSYSTASGTWMWAWANMTVATGVKRDIQKVKEFGERRKFTELIEPKFACDEARAWTLTAAAGEVLDAKGTFRGRIQDGWIYFLITEIRRVDK